MDDKEYKVIVTYMVFVKARSEEEAEEEAFQHMGESGYGDPTIDIEEV